MKFSDGVIKHRRSVAVIGGVLGARARCAPRGSASGQANKDCFNSPNGKQLNYDFQTFLHEIYLTKNKLNIYYNLLKVNLLEDKKHVVKTCSLIL